MPEPRDPQVGDPVILRGQIVRIDEGVAVVAIHRTSPVGMCAAVQCGALELDEQAAGGQESEATAIQRAVDEAAANPGRTIDIDGEQ
jgi:hypothetical protein